MLTGRPLNAKAPGSHVSEGLVVGMLSMLSVVDVVDEGLASVVVVDVVVGDPLLLSTTMTLSGRPLATNLTGGRRILFFLKLNGDEILRRITIFRPSLTFCSSRLLSMMSEAGICLWDSAALLCFQDPLRQRT